MDQRSRLVVGMGVLCVVVAVGAVTWSVRTTRAVSQASAARSAAGTATPAEGQWPGGMGSGGAMSQWGGWGGFPGAGGPQMAEQPGGSPPGQAPGGMAQGPFSGGGPSPMGGGPGAGGGRMGGGTGGPWGGGGGSGQGRRFDLRLPDNLPPEQREKMTAAFRDLMGEMRRRREAGQDTQPIMEQMRQIREALEKGDQEAVQKAFKEARKMVAQAPRETPNVPPPPAPSQPPPTAGSPGANRERPGERGAGGGQRDAWMQGWPGMGGGPGGPGAWMQGWPGMGGGPGAPAAGTGNGRRAVPGRPGQQNAPQGQARRPAEKEGDGRRTAPDRRQAPGRGDGTSAQSPWPRRSPPSDWQGAGPGEMFWPPQGSFPDWGAGGPDPRRPREEPSPLRQVANARAELRFNSENGALEVYDSVTRCTWKQAVGDADLRASHVEVQEDAQGKRIKAELLGPVPCLVTVDLIHEQQADVLVTITPKNVLSGEEDDALVIPYPYPFQAAANSRLALPTQPRETFVGAKGSWNRPDWFVVAKDLTAPWFGCAAPAGGYVGVVQEPAGWQCALQVIHPTAAKGDKGASPCYTVRPVWRHASGDLVAELRILYHFSSVATYAGLSQAYEEVEKRMGIFAMLEEN